MCTNLQEEWFSTLTTADTGRVKLARRCVLLRGNFKTAASLLRRGNIVFALLYQRLKLADITSAVTVLKITHFTDAAGGCLGLDRFAGNLQMAINNCKVLTLTGHGRGLFASGEKAAVKWQSQTSTPLQLNTTSGLLQKVRRPWHVTACVGSKTFGKTGLIFGPKNIVQLKRLRIRQRIVCERRFWSLRASLLVPVLLPQSHVQTSLMPQVMPWMNESVKVYFWDLDLHPLCVVIFSSFY